MEDAVLYTVDGIKYNRKELSNLTGMSINAIQQQDKLGILSRDINYSPIISPELVDGYYLLNKTMLARYLGIRTETFNSLIDKGFSYEDIYYSYIEVRNFKLALLKNSGVKTITELRDKYYFSDKYLDAKTTTLRGLEIVSSECHRRYLLLEDLKSKDYRCYEKLLEFDRNDINKMLLCADSSVLLMNIIENGLDSRNSKESNGKAVKRAKASGTLKDVSEWVREDEGLFVKRKGLKEFFRNVYGKSVNVDGVEYKSLRDFLKLFSCEADIKMLQKICYKWYEYYEDLYSREFLLTAVREGYFLFKKGVFSKIESPGNLLRYHRKNKIFNVGVLYRTGLDNEGYVKFFYSLDFLFSFLKNLADREKIIYIEEGIVDGEYFIYREGKFIGNRFSDILSYYDISFGMLHYQLFSDKTNILGLDSLLRCADCCSLTIDKRFYISGLVYPSLRSFCKDLGISLSGKEDLKFVSTSKDFLEMFFKRKNSNIFVKNVLGADDVKYAYVYKNRVYFLVLEGGSLRYVSDLEVLTKEIERIRRLKNV